MRSADIETRNGILGMGIDEFPMLMSMDFDSHSLLQGIGGQDDYMLTGIPQHAWTVSIRL